MSFSPVTDSDADFDSSDLEILLCRKLPSDSSNPSQSEQHHPNSSLHHFSDPDTAIARRTPSFKLVGDNIDKTINPRYMRADSKSRSLHYFHAYAVRDRIDTTGLNCQLAPTCLPSPAIVAQSLLPSTENDKAIFCNLKILFSRILVETLPFFKTAFSDLVVHRIIHRRSEEMSTKSIVVSERLYVIILVVHSDFLLDSLGVLPKNENKIKEMVDILKHLHQYVPVHTSENGDQCKPPSQDTIWRRSAHQG